jgi:hypothetical protein
LATASNITEGGRVAGTGPHSFPPLGTISLDDNKIMGMPMRNGVRGLLAIGMMTPAACAPIYPVQIAPLGNETYIATQTSLSSWLDARAAALKRAAAWCEKRGGTFAALNSDQQRVALPLASNDHASVEFTCTGMTRKD